MPVNLLDFDRQGLRKFFAEELSEKAFRADQVMKWIYHFGCDDFEQMTKLLGCPVLPISAKYGQGLEKINNTINTPKKIKTDLQAIDEQLLSQNIFDKTVKMPLILNDKKTKLLDSVFLHPFFGIPIFS